MIDRNDPSCEVEAACCKVFGSEKSFEAINEAIQIMGGMGFMKVRDTHLLYRACPEVQLYDWVFTTVGQFARCLHVHCDMKYRYKVFFTVEC